MASRVFKFLAHGRESLSRSPLQLDFHIHPGGQIELHQGIDRFVGRVDDVHQTQMGPNFHLFALRLVNVRRTQQVETLNPRG